MTPYDQPGSYNVEGADESGECPRGVGPARKAKNVEFIA
jgi:hypothetical protein